MAKVKTPSRNRKKKEPLKTAKKKEKKEKEMKNSLRRLILFSKQTLVYC
jgi:hypothetical protein